MNITIDDAQVRMLAARVREMPDATLAKFYLEERFGVTPTLGADVAVDVPPGGGKAKRKATAKSADGDPVSRDAAEFAAAVKFSPGGRVGDYMLNWDTLRRGAAAAKARKEKLVVVDGASRYHAKGES